MIMQVHYYWYNDLCKKARIKKAFFGSEGRGEGKGGGYRKEGRRRGGGDRTVERPQELR